jgi:hypothetical protein
MSQVTYEILKLLLNKYGTILIIIAIFYAIILVIDFYNASNIEKMLEDSRIKIVRRILYEFWIVIITLMMSISLLSEIDLYNISLSFIMGLYLIFLLPYSLYTRLGIERLNIEKIRNNRFKKLVIFSKNKSIWFRISNFLFSIIWVQIAFISITYELGKDINMGKQSVLNSFFNLVKMDYRFIWAYLILATFIYGVYRVIIGPSLISFFSYPASNYLFTVILNTGKPLEDYFLLKVNYKHYLLSKENSLYTNSEIIAVDKSDVKRIVFKHITD